MTQHNDRHLAIVLYKFVTEPRAVAQSAGYDDVEVLAVGDLVGRRPSLHNRITWRFPLFNDDPWDVGADVLIAALGGDANLKATVAEVAPDAAWMRVAVPSTGSPWQESGGFNRETLRRIVDIGLGLDIAVFDYDQTNPTHGLRPERNS